MTVDLTGVETKAICKELVRRCLRAFHSKPETNNYRKVAAQYGVDANDDSLVSRFFLEVVPGFSPEEQAAIETALLTEDSV